MPNTAATLSATSVSSRAGAILVVDDEVHIRDALGEALAPLADRVLSAATGAEGIAIAQVAQPDLIVLDLGLPDMSGAAVCQALRQTSNNPIVVLSARHGEDQKVEMLTIGADDYVTKPFSVGELVARVNAQLRRARMPAMLASSAVTYDGLAIDFALREVRRDGQPVRLTRTEWQLLQTFVSHAGRTLTHQQIFDAVWAKSFGNPQQYLRVHLTNLRRKIEREPATPKLIITEPGVGYRFAAPEE